MTGVQAALRFLDAARRDVAIRAELEDLGENLAYDDLIRLGHERDLLFDPDDLTRAHAIAWRLRQARYGLR